MNSTMNKPTASVLLCLAALLTACGSLRQTTDPIPPLNPKGDVYKTEGPNDPLIYKPAIGQRKAILLYVDFPDKPQTADTAERGKKLLAGDAFQKLFNDNSYGKLSIHIDHVHGWRRMPKDAGAYDCDTTEGHRDMYVDLFALYPEVNLLDYDYIMVSMNAHGNVAFGERDDLAIPYRGKKINTALNQGSMSYFTLAHELAHCMGLPDLYTYGDLQPKNPAGPWSIMSSSRGASGFIGWHRHKLGWLDANRKAYLPTGTQTFTLTSLDSDAGTSMIVVPVDNPEHPSKVFVIELAQALRRDDAPKPGGVLIYSIDATKPTGENPMVVYPRETLINAPFYAGDTFTHDDAPMQVQIIKQNDDGSSEIKVTVK